MKSIGIFVFVTIYFMGLCCCMGNSEDTTDTIVVYSNNIYFDLDDNVDLSASEKGLDSLVSFLGSDSNMECEISVCFCGPIQPNESYSRTSHYPRIYAILDELYKYGINTDRIGPKIIDCAKLFSANNSKCSKVVLKCIKN